MPAYLVELDDGRKFRVEADAPPTSEEILSYLQAPAQPEPDQPGRLGSFASSVGRGALSVVPGTIGGVGYLTGSDTLTEAADTIEGGINRMLPVNPEYQDEFLMKAGGALGRAGGMLLTGGATGAAGKALALSRGLEAAQAAAKGTSLARNVLTGTGVLQGTRGGGQAAEQYGMQGGTAYARALLGGAIEGLSERALFGMGTELAPVKKFLGDTAEKGVGSIIKAAGTEAGEEAAAQIGGNVATSVLAPYGVETPGVLAGAGEAALLGGIAGGALGGVNALMQPSPTIEGEAMIPAETPPEQPETDELGVEAFRQEMVEIAQNPDPIEPLKEITTKAAEVSVAQNAELLPATSAVIAAGGLKPAPAPAPAPRAIGQVFHSPMWGDKIKGLGTGSELMLIDGSVAEGTVVVDQNGEYDMSDGGRVNSAYVKAFKPKGAASFTPVVPKAPVSPDLVEVEVSNRGGSWYVPRKQWESGGSLLDQVDPEKPTVSKSRVKRSDLKEIRQSAPGGLKPAPIQEETPVGAPVVGQPASGVLLPETTPVEVPVEPVVEVPETLDQLRERMRAAIAAQPIEQEPELEQPEAEPPVVEETAAPVEPIPAVEEAPAPTQRAIAEEDKAEFAELQDLMRRRGQAQNKVKGVSFSKKDEARFQELGAKLRRYLFEPVDPVNDPVVGEDINDQPIRQSAQGTFYTVENGRVRTGPAFKLDPEYSRQQDELLRQKKAAKESPAPPLPEEQFPKVENVVAPAGETEVGLEMEETPKTGMQRRQEALDAGLDRRTADAVGAFTDIAEMMREARNRTPEQVKKDWMGYLEADLEKFKGSAPRTAPESSLFAEGQYVRYEKQKDGGFNVVADESTWVPQGEKANPQFKKGKVIRKFPSAEALFEYVRSESTKQNAPSQTLPPVDQTQGEVGLSELQTPAAVTEEKETSKTEKSSEAETAPAQEAPKPAPAAASELDVVGIANARVKAQRERLSLEEITGLVGEAYSFPQMWADSESALKANSTRGAALVTELNDKPRNISALEVAILLREEVARTNALNLAMEEFNAAPKGNNEAERKRMDDAVVALTELDNAANVAGTEQGRSLNARKLLSKLDYTLPKMLTTLSAANDGGLKDGDLEMVTRLQKRLKDVQDKLAEVESGQAARLAEAEKVAFEAGRQEVLKDIEERAKADAAKIAEMQKRRDEYQKAKKEAATKPNKWAEIREAARARNAELRSNLYSDVVLVKAASMAVNDVIIGATYIAEGVTKLADWVTSMRAEGYNLPDAEMEQLFNESKAFDAGEALPVAEAPLKTKKAKAPVIDRVKAIAADEEQLDSRTVYNFVVEKMKAWAEASQGAKLPEMSEADLTSVIREVTADIKQYFPDITEREIRDLFSGYGKILMPSQDELSKQVRQLSALGKLASAIEDAMAQRAPLKSGPQRDRATQAIRLQQKKLARELRMMGREYEAGEEQLRSPLDAIKARLNNEINDIDFEIRKGKTPRRPTPDYDPEAKALVELRDELKRISDVVNAPAGPTLEETVAEEMKKLDKRIEELQKLIAEGKFKPKEDTLLHTAELDQKRETRDTLNKTLQKMRKEAADKLRTQEDIDEEAIKSLEESIKELNSKIEKADYALPQRRTPTQTAAYKALVKEKEALQKKVREEREKLFGRKGMSDEQRIKLATAAIDKSMARIQGMLTSGNYEVPKRVSKTPETPELKAKRDARDALRKQLIQLRKLKRDAAIDPIAKQIATDKKRIQTRMKKLKKRMDDGDFSKPVKKQRATDDALLKLQIEEEDLKEQWAKIVFERQLASRGPGKKLLDATQQTLNTSRAILTSVDVSAVLRQGGFIVLGNPLRGFRNLGPMFKAFADAEFAKGEKFRMERRENYKNGLYQQSKLFLSDTSKVNQMNKQEEAFMTRWIEKIPKSYKALWVGSVLRGSQRAYTVFLNRLRMDTFDAMVGNLKKGDVPTPQETATAAGFINTATGRGDLGKFNQSGTLLNTVFFAPRLVWSRFLILSGQPYFAASGRTKALVLREYAKFLTGASVVYALGMLAQDEDDEPLETDPRSSDFLKIRFGDTRVDPLSGLIQATVFVSRLVAGEKKTAKGKIVPLRPEYRLMNLFRETPRTDEVKYGGDVATDVMKNFLRSKLSPIVGSAVNLLDMKNVVGEDSDPTTEAERMVIPMSFMEMKETLEAQGVPEATALIMLQLFGMGVQTYTPGKK